MKEYYSIIKIDESLDEQIEIPKINAKQLQRYFDSRTIIEVIL